jgi:hypothetical protein
MQEELRNGLMGQLQNANAMAQLKAIERSTEQLK